MSGISEKQRMREALQLTEGNLSSLIHSRYDNGQSEQTSVMVRAMVIWRREVRKALGAWSHMASVGNLTPFEVSALVDSWSDDEILQAISPRQMLRALRHWEAQTGKQVLKPRADNDRLA